MVCFLKSTCLLITQLGDLCSTYSIGQDLRNFKRIHKLNYINKICNNNVITIYSIVQ